MKELKLDSRLFIARGQDRECYRHPEDEDKCIKVTVSGDFRQSRDEIKYYRRMQKRGISWEHLARFHGIVATDLGQGLVFDLVRDEDGNISRNLRDYLQKGGCPLDRGALTAELRRLCRYLFSEQIIMRDLKDENLLLRVSGENHTRLIIIDGVGNNDLIPLADHIAFLRRQKIHRKWDRFATAFSRRFDLNLSDPAPGDRGA